MHIFTPAEIDAVQAALGRDIPALYRRLLTERGHGREGDIEIYHPLRIRALYEPFFDDPSQLFSAYFPFGCNNRTQEIWIIDLRSGKAASIWHETVPEDWPEEEWHTCEVWIRGVLNSPTA